VHARAIYACLAALCLSAANSWAVSTDTWAQVCTNNNTVCNNDSDSDQGLTHADCSSYVSWAWGSWSSADASADRDLATGHLDLYTAVDSNIVVGDTAQARAGAHGLDYGDDDIIYGPGAAGTGDVNLGHVVLVVNDLLATTTVNLNFEINGLPVASGSATLEGNGMLMGTGVYVPSNFNVIPEPNGYRAVYTGPPAVSWTFNVDSFFDVWFDTDVQTSPYNTGAAAVQHVWMDLPPNYVLVTEKRLTIRYKNPQYGHVDLDPPPVDPNLLRYPLGSFVTLTAEPNEGKSFKKWKIFDPNDPNLGTFVIDTNNPITILIDNHRLVKVFFKCGGGGGLLPLLLMMLAVLGLYVLARRRSAWG